MKGTFFGSVLIPDQSKNLKIFQLVHSKDKTDERGIKNHIVSNPDEILLTNFPRNAL